jgi:hypothetical protein
MEYKILVPSGIGDFSWLWSKISTTNDSFFVEYADMIPDRLAAFLALLPKEKITGWAINKKYRCVFDTAALEMAFMPRDHKKIELYSDLAPDVLNVVEANTHLERGGRIESWLPDLPVTDLHYKINGLARGAKRQGIFPVHLSSFKVHGYWKYYDIPVWVDMVSAIQQVTGWRPVFIGGDYDDFAQACFEKYIERFSAINLIGCTPDLKSIIPLIQQSKFFMGAVSSGLTMLANVLSIPTASWWPRPKLPPSWPDLNIPYLWFLWKNAEEDKEILLNWIKEI